jgi:molybdate transport system regulatory protein
VTFAYSPAKVVSLYVTSGTQNSGWRADALHIWAMASSHVFIRLDLSNGKHIGPGKIALLEAIRAEGSILAASRHFGMSYRHAWLAVREINKTLRRPVVATTRARGGAELTPLGEQIVEVYRRIEGLAYTSTRQELRAIARLLRRRKERAASKRTR